jgi:ribosomal protein L37E
MGHFQVLFSGELAAGADTAAVRNKLAAKLRIDSHKVNQLFSGRTVVLRSELDESAAFALQADLDRLGVITRVKDRTPVAPEMFRDRTRTDAIRRDSTLKDITAAHFECPRCGFLQLEAEHCARCGANIAQAMRERRKEDLLIERRIRELRARKVRTAAQHGRHALTSTVAQRANAVRPAPPESPRSDVHRDHHQPAVTRAGAWLRGLLGSLSR